MKQISAQEVEQLLAEGAAINIVDVREVDEVQAVHIPNIIHIPLGLLEFRMNELNKNEAYYVICHAGGRSAQAVNFLDSHGYDVTNISGGMMAWTGPTA